MKKVLFWGVIAFFLSILPLYSTSISATAAENDDTFLQEDFQEPVPDYGQQEVATPAVVEKAVTAQPVQSARPKFSVRKRTYLMIMYGGTSYPADSWLNKELKDANDAYKTSVYKKAPYTLIISGATGGMEVRKGWSDNLMLGLAVYQSVGESPEKVLHAAGGYDLKASARFDVTSTFVNVYLYGPLSQRLEYYIGVGPGISSGIIEWNEKENKLYNVDYSNGVAVKAFGAHLFAGVDWKIFDNFLMELNVFYRAMELQSISLTGGGGTLGLVMAF